MRYQILDVECYQNYFLLLMLDPATGVVKRWEMHDDFERSHRTRLELRQTLASQTTVTFNGTGYDMWMISGYIDGLPNAILKELSDYLVSDHMAQWKVGMQYGLNPPKGKHIDLMPTAPLVASLKIYAGRLHAPKLQDLPIDPSELITEDYRDALIEYCINDLHVTHRLHVKLKPQILLRHQMSKRYDLDLISKSDPQIAESVIRKLLLDKGVRQDKSREPATSFRYDVPACVSVKTPQIKGILEAICESDFILGKSRIKCPKELAAPVPFGQLKYKLGMGGLHSQEKHRTIRLKPGELLTDFDVTSYYPSLILTNGYYPEALGPKFIDVYQGLVDDRIAAKKSGDTVTADALKIVINSSFGKFGNKYSCMYSPKLLLQTTFSGQLYLFMLIEMLETRTDCRVVSANTDGITVFSPSVEQYQQALKVTAMWQSRTDMVLEAIQYSALYSQDVNNYVAVKLDGSTKGKGIFAGASLSKSPVNPIIPHATVKYLTEGADPESTIRECSDIRAFCSLRKVTGGALYRDDNVGSTIRWYHSTSGSPLMYFRDARRVPDGDDAQLLNQLPDTFPSDVNYDWYINATRELITAVGSTPPQVEAGL